MKQRFREGLAASAAVAAVFFAPAGFAAASSAAESSCMQAVNSNYGGKVRNLRVVSSEFSQANSEVIVQADGERWRCLVSEDGEVQDLSVQQGGRSSSTSGATTASGFQLQGRARGHCELSNASAGRQLYSGDCTIKQTVNGRTNVFEIKMGSAQSFLFASSDGVNWMHGPEKVRFRDRGDSAVFRWSDFRLEVHQD